MNMSAHAHALHFVQHLSVDVFESHNNFRFEVFEL